MRDRGEAMIRSLDITNGLKVLDLGCGDGTTALPAAKAGAARRPACSRGVQRSSSAGGTIAGDAGGVEHADLAVDIAASRRPVRGPASRRG
jgi:predicted RNA methylase